MIQQGIRYFQTLRYLKVTQLYYQGYYRMRSTFFPDRKVLPLVNSALSGAPLRFLPFVSKQRAIDHGSFSFLNRSKLFGDDYHRIDWGFDGNGKLWTYNLNYFDFLLQPGFSQDIGLELIEVFTTMAPAGGVGFESYPISLRGINWIKFLSLHGIRRADIDASLFAQYRVLLKNLEYHLLGNHLLENAFSLLFGACYFNQKAWYDRSRKLLERELEEQVLDDGAHFELSPMYHQILIDRMLDCVNLLQNNNCFSGQDEFALFLRKKVINMLRWLKTMTFADGSIPLLNDATTGIAPTSHVLFGYAERLGIGVEEMSPVSLRGSGYRKFCGTDYECLVDVGAIGPDYIPGHAHADTFNFLVHLKGKPFLEDTGISTYEKCALRDAERGTAAHNTVVVNGMNSSDVWGGFRVGRRARVRLFEDGLSVIEAEHDGYRHFGVRHRRRWRFEAERIVVSDMVYGQAQTARACFHFACGLNPVVSGNRVEFGGSVLEFNGAEEIESMCYQKALEFNKAVDAWCLVVRFCRSLESTITFS